MAIIWMDMLSGNDSTGNGSYLTPYQSGTKSVNSCSSDDKLRIKATGPDTNIVSNCTFRYNSTTVNTSSDLTGSVAVGDWIGKGGVSKANGIKEHYYRVTARNATTITLESPYFGKTETVASIDKLKFESIAHTAANNTALFGRSSLGTSSRLQISGGWDSETTQNGITWVRPSNFIRNNSYFIFNSYSDWYNLNHDVSKVNFVDFGKIDGGSNIDTFTDCTFLGYGAISIYSGTTYFLRCCNYNFNAQTYMGYSNYYTFEDMYFFGRRSTSDFFYSRAVGYYRFINCEAYGMYYMFKYFDNNLTENAINFSGGLRLYNSSGIFEYDAYGANIDLTGLEVYDCYCLINNSGDNSYFKGAKAYRCTSNAIYLTQSSNCKYENFYFEDCAEYNVYGDTYSCNNMFVDCHFENPTTAGLYPYPNTTGHRMVNCTVSVGKPLIWNGSGAYGGYLPRVHISNSPKYNGKYDGRYQLVEDIPVHTTEPSWTFKNLSTYNLYNNSIGISLYKFYTLINTTRIVKLKYKMDPGWITTSGLIFGIRLNRHEIQKETAIMSEVNDWTEIVITIPNTSIYANGTIELTIYPNGNTIPIHFDNFEVIQ